MRTWSSRSFMLTWALAFAGASVAQAPPGPPPEVSNQRARYLAEAEEKRLICPIYSITDDSWASLYLINMSAQAVISQVTAVTPHGARFLVAIEEIDGQRHARLDLAAELLAAPPPFGQGAIEISFRGGTYSLQAWTVLRVGEQWLEVPCTSPSHPKRLTAFLPSLSDDVEHASSRATMYLYNAGERPVPYRLATDADDRHRLLPPNQRHALALPPGDRTHVDLTFATEDAGIVAAVLLADGELLMRTPLMDQPATRPPRQVSLPFRWPAAGERALITVFNAASEKRKVSVQVIGQGPMQTVETLELELAPEEVRTLDLLPLNGASATEPDGRQARLEVSANGSGVSTFGLLDRGPTGTVTEIPIFPHPDVHAGGAYPVPDLTAHRVTTTLFNAGAEASRILAHLYWKGGSYALPPIQIPPGESHVVDYDRLIAEPRPDLLDRIPSLDAAGAYFRWTVHSGGTEILARTDAGPRGSVDRFGFNCSGFCCAEMTIGDLVPQNITFPAGGSGTFQACQWIESCDGTMGPFPPDNPIYTFSSPFTWNGTTVASSQAASQTLSFSFDGYVVDEYHCSRRNMRMGDSGPAVAAQVFVISADLMTNKIRVELKPVGLSGNLKVYLKGPSGVRAPFVNTVYSSGVHDNITFGSYGSYTRGQSYDTVVAEWTVNGKVVSGTFPYRFDAFGSYLHTRYNTPTELHCTGAATDFCFFTGTCTKVNSCTTPTHASGRFEWIREVQENGSGVHSSLGAMSREWFCALPGGCAYRFRQIPAPCPTCAGMSVGTNGTVAISQTNRDLACGSRVFVPGVGTRIVTDNGGGLRDDQLDHYSGISGCNRTGGTIGTAPVFRLY